MIKTRVCFVAALALFTVAACKGHSPSSSNGSGGSGGLDGGGMPGNGSGGSGGGSGGNGTGGNGTPDGATTIDPLAPLPDASQGLTNVSSDLDAVLENGTL